MAATLLVLLNTADVIEFAQRTFPSAPARFDYPSTPALKFLRAQPGMFRVCSAWDLETQSPTARPNLLMTAGLDDPRVYESLSPTNPILARQDWDELNVRYFVCPPDSVSPVTEGRRVYHGEVDIFENPHAQPRVYFATELNGPATAAARIEEYVSGGIRLTVTAPQAGWLVVRERSYPGWRVQVNGKPAVADRAQEFWLAVPVAAGDSEVQWRFQPATVRWGATTSGLALIGIGMLWMWDRKRPVR